MRYPGPFGSAIVDNTGKATFGCIIDKNSYVNVRRPKPLGKITWHCGQRRPVWIAATRLAGRA